MCQYKRCPESHTHTHTLTHTLTSFGNMKVLLVTLMLLLLCSTQVLTLRCFTCNGGDQNPCTTVTECSSEETVCKTTFSSNKIQKGCAPACDEKEPLTSCCEVDLC
ncbi:lymphocyte antigen 6D [Dunckerocampus dactyliophorus]|uniref:lymphocyte antigen 6D n=1 Tax=Dunckerocampus dactyliophorus TaxID=161453 RepID=UPI002406882B|nr:lymphocyte antigen 6D [Dunckerocampus dactyliophorus]